ALEVRRPVWWLLVAGVMTGAAGSGKRLGFKIIGPTLFLWFFPHLFDQTKNSEQPRWTWPVAIGCFFFLPAVIYWLVFRLHFGWLGLPDTFFQLNQQMLNYHLSVPAIGDPYAQPWLGWLVMWQPLLYW